MSMRISYLLAGFGHTGGSMVLYKFMDKLCERGYEVFAITPTERVQWRSDFSHTIVERIKQSKSNPTKVALYDFGKTIVKRSRLLESTARVLLGKLQVNPIEQLQWLTQRLIQNWIHSEITISTFCTTSYANYALMDKTIPMYHMQHYEELFFDNEVSQKIARLTYYLPLELIANSSWLQSQIKERIGRDSYLLNPGIDTGVFYPRMDVDRKYKDPSKISVVSYYSPSKFKAWDDAVEAMKIVFEKVGNDRVEWFVFGGIPSSVPDFPVKFVGKIFGDSLSQLYSNAHIVFMNSWYESFPLPPLEGMACGTAVVTTRIGTEDYAFDGKNSLVVPHRKPAELAAAILRLIEEPSLAHNLAEAGVETARQFTWDKVTDRLEEILHQAQDNASKKKFVDVPDLLTGKM